jgi:hypothetical protein
MVRAKELPVLQTAFGSKLNCGQPVVQCPFTTIAILRRLSRQPRQVPPMDMSNLPKDVDQVAVVVDWLDACRRHDLGPLLDLYASDARLECECEGANTYAGRAALEAYWRPRLEAFSPDAFRLQEIAPSADGVVLDYLNFEGKLVRIVFTFDLTGKILQNRCGLSFRVAPQCTAANGPSG